MAEISRKEILTKSKERVQKHGEVFTPEWVVKDMCDMLQENNQGEDVFRPDTTFLEPTCGTGNFLVEILKRKLNMCKDTEDCFTSLRSIYGVDIMPDNIQESKERMLDIFVDCCGHREEAMEILDRNIVCGDFRAKKTVNGSPIWFLEDTEDEQLTVGGF